MNLDIWVASKATIFVLLVIPGFVSLKVYELIYPTGNKDTSKQLIDAVAYSCLNYALLFWPIHEVESSRASIDHPNLYALFYLAVLFLCPVLWVLMFQRLRTLRWLQGILPHPIGRAWDYVFGQRRAYWVIVTLTDGERVAGRYDSNSFASSFPAPDQIYLEETWHLNHEGGFDRPRAESAGTLVLANIKSIEFFNMTFGETSD